jgi:hypothetical protein
MDNPENTEGANKMDNPVKLVTRRGKQNGQSRETGNTKGQTKWTIQRNWQYEGANKIDNPEKLATYGTQDKEKQSKNTTQYVLDTTLSKQTQITLIRHEPSCIINSHLFFL